MKDTQRIKLNKKEEIRMKKLSITGTLIIIVTLTWTLCSLAAEPIRIGSPLLLSGTGAYVGGAEKDTLEMMAADLNKAGGINGRPLEFIFYDEEGQPDVAVSI